MEHGVALEDALETALGHAGHVLVRRAFVTSAVSNMLVFFPLLFPPIRFSAVLPFVSTSLHDSLLTFSVIRIFVKYYAIAAAGACFG